MGTLNVVVHWRLRPLQIQAEKTCKTVRNGTLLL